jgi:hypothetical protein
MTKKLSGGKSARQTQKSARRHSGKTASNPKASTHKRHREAKRRPSPQAFEPLNQGIPEEHYYGEETAEVVGRPVDATSLDAETLSKDAPYNRTYGRQDSEGR